VRLDALTGLSHGQRAELLRRVVALLGTTVITRPGGRPSALCLEGSVDLVCVLLRTNITQDQAACLFEVSQATASRRWDLLRGVIATALAALVPTVRQIVGNGGTVLVDGFLAPTWDWKDAEDMVVDPGEHLALGPVGQVDPADQVQLPQVHRCFPLPPLVLAPVALLLVAHQAVARQHAVHGGPRGRRGHPGLRYLERDARRTPARVGPAHLAGKGLHVGGQPRRAGSRPTRRLAQRVESAGRVLRPPRVDRLPRHPVAHGHLADR
jgi:hypothetical protein